MEIKLFTTPLIQGYDILSYEGVVSAQQVVGINAVSESIAAISDLFGGHSGEFRREIEKLKDDVTSQAVQQAESMGANAIVGFNIIINEISGKGMMMFMANAIGTAVVTRKSIDCSSSLRKYRLIHELNMFKNENIINEDEYNYEYGRITDVFESLIYHEELQYKEERGKREIDKKLLEEEKAINDDKFQKEEIINNCTKVILNLNLIERFSKIENILNNLTDSDIENADYESLQIPNLGSLPLKVKYLGSKSLWAEACNLYIDETGFDVSDARNFVKRVNTESNICNEEDCENLAKKVIRLHDNNEDENAVETISRATSLSKEEAQNVFNKMLEFIEGKK